jgi:hypothetical protein
LIRPLAIVLILLVLLVVLGIPVVPLGLAWIVAHPLRVMGLLLIMLTLLLVGYGLCTTHVVSSFPFVRRLASGNHHVVNVSGSAKSDTSGGCVTPTGRA